MFWCKLELRITPILGLLLDSSLFSVELLEQKQPQKRDYTYGNECCMQNE